MCCLVLGPVRADDGKIAQFSGATMGTRYMVKIFDPPGPDPQAFVADVQLRVDGLLRQVNDQMSTYLQSSEISRFNSSASTDWFAVSRETADVVEFAQQVARKSNGAFDVTVGPLVNAWSFGPGPRSRTVPDGAQLRELQGLVGFEKLSVRLDPPALRKAIPGMQVDLSAIAKGFGVDQVVALLQDAGAEDVFVEIGGEVRTSGNKAGQWWKVGIQLPDAATDSVMIAHPLSTGSGNDQAMATSGDYRNYFEADGVRYSHTIDPRTASPIRHSLASVSVLAESCMEADAWATAINVLGPEEGLRLAERERLNTLMISRTDEGFERQGTGTLAVHASPAASGRSPAEPVAAPPSRGNGLLAITAITVVALATILLAMSVGVIFGRREISGSCGGLANQRNEDGSVSCSLCSNPDDACKELRRRMQQTDKT